MDEDRLKSLILDTLKSYNKKKIRRRELYGKIGVRDIEYDDFKRVLTDMEKSGEVVRIKGRRFALPEKSATITGIFSARRNGGGNVRTPDGYSVYVRHAHIEGALTGDRVLAKTLRKRHYGLSRAAKILSIIERRTKPVVGIFRKRKKTAYIVPREDGFSHNLLVKEGGECNAADGEMVVAHIERDSTGFSHPLSVVTEVLGYPDAPGVDVLSIAFRHDLPVNFPDEVIAESEQVRADLSPDELDKRLDLRGTVTFTIDPVDARDFDDAISISRTEGNGFELGVHIADVSHYVYADSAMDRDARTRGMSCYLAGRVIPMLPERLSNELCSLKPAEDRLTKSVFVSLDSEGNILSHNIANTVIHSRKRLTYEQVQAYLDSRNVDSAGDIPVDVGEALRLLSDLTDRLIKRREERGALDFELPEAQVMLDDDGKPVDILKRSRFKAHRMVEEAMLLANTITAEKLKSIQAPFLYRIHDKPDEEKLRAFGEIAVALGYEFRASHTGDDGYVQSFIKSISGKKHEQLLNMLLLRSMKKAAYSSSNIGHYGLGLSTYAHFTSPIRRYPDLIVHRQLDTFVLLDGKNKVRNDGAFYENLGEAITKREIVTDTAERESIKMKTAEFMRDHLGEEFEGTISGMIPAGFFVELDRNFVEGLVHVSSLHDDYYEIDKNRISMSGKNSRRRFAPGDRVRVIVARADKERGEVDFVLVEKGKKKKRKKRKKLK